MSKTNDFLSKMQSDLSNLMRGEMYYEELPTNNDPDDKQLAIDDPCPQCHTPLTGTYNKPSGVVDELYCTNCGYTPDDDFNEDIFDVESD